MGFSPGNGGVPGGGGLPGPPPITIGSSGGASDAAATSQAIQEVEVWTGEALSWVQSLVNSLFGGLVHELQTIFADIWKWLKGLADTWLGQLVKDVWNKVKEIYSKIAAIVKEIICYLEFWEALQNYYWKLIFQPILQVLSSLRRVLLVFKIFHLKFAQELDRWLAAREAALGKIFLDQRAELNRIIGYLNYLLDPFGLTSEGLYLQTALRSIKDLWAALRQVTNNPLDKDQLTANAVAAHQVYRTQVIQDTQTVTSAGLTPEQLEPLQYVTDLFSSWGY